MACPQEAISLYRTTYLLNDLHNILFGSVFVPITKLAVVLALFICAVAVTVLRAVIHYWLVVTFLLYTFTLIPVIIPAAFSMSQVYNLSSNVKQNLSMIVA